MSQVCINRSLKLSNQDSVIVNMPRIVVKLIFLFLLWGTYQVDGAKILGVVHFPSRSHHILMSSLLKALAARGHEVTMLSGFPLKTPIKNYEDIELTGIVELSKKGNLAQTLVQTQNISFLEHMSAMMRTIEEVDNAFLGHPAVRKLIMSKRKFDIVIQAWFSNEAYLALGYYLGASTIAFSTLGSSIMNSNIMENPTPYSYVPNMFPPFPSEMNFLQRVGNTLSCIGMELFGNFYMSRKQELLKQKYFPDAPAAYQLRRNISLVLLNAHFSIESPRPYVPGMVQVGGLHVEEAKELKGDLKQFMDSAVEGVVFFSLGSNIGSSDLPPEKLNAIVKSFAKLPLKVLWKFESDNIPNLPKNVKIGKWLPQNDILAHPNLKVFVTHGGLLSTTEAVYFGVPMVGMPFFADQDSNVDDGVRKGYLVKVSYLDLTESTLTKAINEVLNNPKYRNNVKQRSAILRDQPLKPLDNAVYWVEYVVRHNGAHHLKSGALKLNWYQYYLLDVIALIAGIILTVIVGSVFVIRRLLRFVKSKLFKSPKQATPKTVNKKKTKSKLA